MTRSMPLLLAALWAAGALLACGCAKNIDSYYGRRSGINGGPSVNGTAVLGNMFEQAGHRVLTWRYLSPRLWQADTIVWAPNRFQPPSEAAREWLDEWLSAPGPRTLIYIGRDYDAEADYWATIQPVAPIEQQAEVTRRMREAQARFSVERSDLPADEDCEWFRIRSAPPGTRGAAWGGPWAQGIDASAFEITLNSSLAAPEYAEVLLSYGDQPVVSRQTWSDWAESELEDSQLVVVQNGSFLLNLPLVNREHRKLAGKLVDLAGPPGTVVFLESGPRDDPPIREEDPDPQIPTGMEMFFVWPLNYVLLHLALAGIIFCFSRWPVFGPPRTLPADSRTDFGKHIAAVGDLLGQSRNRGYALARVARYQQVLHEARGGGKERND